MTQNDKMKNAMKQFGTMNEFETNVINATINDNDVITTLLNEYDTNEYNIDKSDMLQFLIAYNDIESNGIVENFVYHENELNA